MHKYCCLYLIFCQEIYSLADKISLRVPDVDALVENLNIEGFLLQKGSGMYQVKS